MKKFSLFAFIAFAVLAFASIAFGHDLTIGLSALAGKDLISLKHLGSGMFLAVGSIQMPHLDANESVFFQRELEYVKTKSYDKKYAKLKARTLIPVSSEAEPWADVIVYDQFDQVGMAKLIAGYSDDLPRADVMGKQFFNPVKSLGASYGYTIMEIRKSAAKGKNLEQRKANAAKRAILQRENDLAFLGDSKVGFAGFLNNANVGTVTVPADNTSTDTEWIDGSGAALKTPAQILRDLHLISNAVLNQTSGVEEADTLLLPRTRFLHIASTPWSTSNDGRTILEVFLQQSMFIKNVDWLNELETAAVSGGRRAMAYRRDPEAVTLEIPQDFEQFDAQPRNLEFVVPCHSRFGGVIFYYPLSAVYADDI